MCPARPAAAHAREEGFALLTTEEMEGAEVAVPGAELVPEFAWWLGELISGDGSDLHLKAGSAPRSDRPAGA